MQNACCDLPLAGVRSLRVSVGAHVESERVERADGQRVELLVAQVRVEVDADAGRHLLEERIVVVPRAQLVGGDPEALRQSGVEVRLQHCEGFVAVSSSTSASVAKSRASS